MFRTSVSYQRRTGLESLCCDYQTNSGSRIAPSDPRSLQNLDPGKEVCHFLIAGDHVLDNANDFFDIAAAFSDFCSPYMAKRVAS